LNQRLLRLRSPTLFILRHRLLRLRAL
jgi:hypothetical protein